MNQIVSKGDAEILQYILVPLVGLFAVVFGGAWLISKVPPPEPTVDRISRLCREEYYSESARLECEFKATALLLLERKQAKFERVYDRIR